MKSTGKKLGLDPETLTHAIGQDNEKLSRFFNRASFAAGSLRFNGICCAFSTGITAMSIATEHPVIAGASAFIAISSGLATHLNIQTLNTVRQDVLTHARINGTKTTKPTL